MKDETEHSKLDDRGPPSFLDDPSQHFWPNFRKGVKNLLLDEARNVLGKPGKLIRLIAENKLTPIELKFQDRNIWYDSACYWQGWNRGWDDTPTPIDFRIMDESFQSRNFTRIPELEDLIEIERQDAFECDITDIKGISASKSMETPFHSIEEFAMSRCRQFIGDGDLDSFKENIKWGEIRLHNMSFRSLEWSDYNLFWMNSGGSHHFAAAHYIASNRKIPFKLKGRLMKATINPIQVMSLCSKWDMYIMHFNTVFGAFIDSMRDYECNFAVCDVPRNLFSNYPDPRIVFLDKSDKKAMEVSKVLNLAGFQRFSQYLPTCSGSPGSVGMRVAPR